MGAKPLRLYHYWRSSSSWRVRWALAHKGIPCEYVAVDLLKGESDSPEHLARNPLGFVPTLEISSSVFLTESLAIIDWLEETHPSPRLLPADPVARARVLQLAETINASTQPLVNLGVAAMHSGDKDEQKRWNQHWLHRGLSAYEIHASRTAASFSVGDELTLADLCLVPQVYNARRMELDTSEFRLITRIFDAALATESGQASRPEAFAPKEAP